MVKILLTLQKASKYWKIPDQDREYLISCTSTLMRFNKDMDEPHVESMLEKIVRYIKFSMDERIIFLGAQDRMVQVMLETIRLNCKSGENVGRIFNDYCDVVN